MTERALFIDRDGVICHMIKYAEYWDSPQRVEDVKIIEGIEGVIKTAKNKGLLVIEISNQPGVAKGKQTQELSDKIEAKVHELLGSQDVDAIYICNHHPNGVVPELTIDCDCRKPKPGLLLMAAQQHNIDLTNSIFYGDKTSDVEAGLAAGCITIILLHNEDTKEKILTSQNTHADFKVNSHEEACKVISDL